MIKAHITKNALQNGNSNIFKQFLANCDYQERLRVFIAVKRIRTKRTKSFQQSHISIPYMCLPV